MADLNPWIRTLLDEIVVATGADIEGGTEEAAVQATVTSQQDNSADDARTNILATLWKFAQFPGGEPVEQDQFNRLTAPLIDFNIKNGNIVVARDAAPDTAPLNHSSSTVSGIKFSPSQRSYEASVSPFTFRLSPIFLLIWDCFLIVLYSPYAIGILWPFSTTNKRAELYLGIGNVITLFFHSILFFFTLTGFVTVVVLFGLLWPMELIVAYIAIIVSLCFPAYLFLNWGPNILSPKVPPKGDHKDEKWFFINGIAVGNYWRQGAIDKLTDLFGRPVYGIENKTHGVILDLVECFIQRDLGYQTEDIRLAYMTIKEALLDPKIKKVVIIAHSQGGIIISMALDNLLSDLPREYFQNLEIYTFAAASNHFNNPGLFKGKDKAAVSIIEHYANANDFVARFGVLEYIFNSFYPHNAFAGGLIVRPRASGHMLVQHYLDPMFNGKTFLDSTYSLADVHRVGPPLKDAVPDTLAALHYTVREASRLSDYLGGQNPPKKPFRWQ